MRIVFKDITLNSHRFYVEANFYNWEPELDEERVYKLTDLGDFNFGHDADKDSVFYPENFDLSFTIAGQSVPIIGRKPNPFGQEINTEQDYKHEYYFLIGMLTFQDANVTVWLDDTIFFFGSADRASVTSDYSNYVINFTSLSNFAKLKNYDPRINPLVFSLNTDQKVFIPDLILGIVRSVLPQVNSIVCHSSLRASIQYTFLGQPRLLVRDINSLAVFVDDYIGYPSAYENYIDLLKDILASFGLVMYIFGRTIVLNSRWYYSSEYFEISDNLLISGPDADSRNAKALKGIRVWVRKGDYTFASPYDVGLVELDENKRIKYPDEVEEIYLTQPMGAPPGIPDTPVNQRNIWAWLPEYISGLGNGQFVPTLPNSAYIEGGSVPMGPLWRVIGDQLGQLVLRERLSVNCELFGVDYWVNPFFILPSYQNRKFRARTIAINYQTYSTVLNLIEV